MKQITTLILIISTFGVFAQHNWDSKNWDKGSIGFGCGFSASMTKPVIKMIHLIVERDYIEIRKLLHSKKPEDQFLSAFVLEKLLKKKELELTEEELLKISELKNSETEVPVCSGCTYWDEQPLSTLLRTNDKHFIYKSAENWFKIYYKQTKSN